PTRRRGGCPPSRTARPSSRPTPVTAERRRRRAVVARHRRPVNVRDDGLTAVLGPLITVGAVERAVLLDVDSGMVLDAWARGEARSPDSAGPGAGFPGSPAAGAVSVQSDETVPDGALFGASAYGPGPGPSGALSGAGSARSDETVPGGAT